MKISRPRLRLAVHLLVAAASMAARNASATTVVEMDLALLTATADRIFVGVVESQQSTRLSAEPPVIVTDVVLRSEQDVLGVPAGTTFVVRHLGGEVGGLGQRVFGEASYHVGERIVLFAAKRQGSYFAVGMAQGVVRVDASAAPRRRIDDVLTEVRRHLSRRVVKK